jgi:hypothetical protein
VTEPQPDVITFSTAVDKAPAPIDELIPWHTFPLAEVKQETEVSPQAIAHDVCSQLLICENPHHLHQLITEFGQAVIDWVAEHLLSTQKRIFLTQHLA